MSTHWHIKTLNQIAENLDNKRVPITKSVRTNGVYPYYGASGVVDYVSEYIFDGDALLISEDGANLLARTTPIAFSVTGKYWVNNHAHVLRFRDISTQRFVEMYLESIPLDKYVTGAAQPKLNQRALNSIPIPFPPIAEQQRIVTILDEAFAAIATAKANTEKNLANARAVFERAVDAVFARLAQTVAGKPLAECVEGISTGPFGSLLHKSDYKEGGIPLVNPINIDGDEIIPDPRKAVSKEIAKTLARYALHKGDVVTARRGEIGRCAVVAAEQAGWLCGTGSFFIRPGTTVDPYFLTHLLRSTSYRSQLERVSARATMPSIGNDDLCQLVVHIPSLTEQHTIEARLDGLANEVAKLQDIVTRKLVALDTLKASLLHHAFTGQLTGSSQHRETANA